jgi:ankyrin repeat protein
MDSEPKMTFNNQVMKPAIQEHIRGPTTSESYNDPQKELIALIRDENVDRVREFLGALPNPEILLNQKDREFQQTPIYSAVQIRNPEISLTMSTVLAELGASFKVKDIHGQSPMFYVCKDGNIPLLKMANSFQIDLNEADNFRQTPLFYASREGHADCIREMIRFGADPNHKDKVNETALFYASRDGRYNAVNVLLDSGADPNVIDDKKQTALFFAKKNMHKEVIDLLVSKGAINTKDGRLTKSDIARATKGLLKSIQTSANRIRFGKPTSIEY